MAKCDRCGRVENMPYNCRYCGGTFCAEHRLPENHDCPGLEEWNDPTGVFDSGFDDSVRQPGGSSGIFDDIGIGSVTRTGGPLAYFRGNVSFTFLALMWLTFAAQWAVILLLGQGVHNALFTLQSNHVEYVWTWITSVFAHSPFSFWHIVGNSIVLYFFGPIVERRIGSRAFVILFLVSGALAGLGFIGSTILLPPPELSPVRVLGASGAIFSVLGVLTVLNPHLRIYLYFILPIPLWLFTLGFAVISIFFFLSPGGGGSIAHAAHLIGLVIGLVYGEHVKRRGVNVPEQLTFGGGPGRGGGRRRF